MENKELKKSVPTELNDETLDMVTGGSDIAETWISLPTIEFPGLIFEGAVEQTPEDH